MLDYPSGNDFGHKEERDGSVVTGKYYVLLPDGRKQVSESICSLIMKILNRLNPPPVQIVNYIADENGYRPTITYEEAASNGGYNNNAQQSGYNNNAQQSGYNNNAQGYQY